MANADPGRAMRREAGDHAIHCRVCRKSKPMYTKDDDRRLICLDCALDGALEVCKQAIRVEVERARRQADVEQ